MSEPPHRNELEEQAIRSYAYELWEEAGGPNNREQEFWLNAEAKLEALGHISIKPIALPFAIIFTASDPGSTWPPAKILCPIMGPATNFSFFEVASRRVEQLFTPPALDPRLLANDYRLVLLQIAAVTAALDRIARLIERIADQDNLQDAPFLVRNPSDRLPRLDPAYLRALLQPHANVEKISSTLCSSITPTHER